MASKRRTVAVALVAALALTLAACGSDDDKDSSSGDATTTVPAGSPDRGNVDGVLKLGLLLPQSGDLAAIHDALLTPITMAVEEINAAGGVNGKEVEYVERDDGTSVDVASSALDTLLTSDKVDAIIGAASSTTTLGIIDKVATNGVLQCSGSNTSAELSVEGGPANGFYFRTAPSDDLQGPALAQLILGDGKTKVAILTRNDSYGTGFGQSLAAALEEGGAEVLENAAYDPNTTNFQGDVAKVVGKGADAIVVIGFNSDGGGVIKEMIAQNVGPADVAVYTADGMQGSSFYEGVDPANPAVVQGIRGTAPALSIKGVEHPFTAKYAETGKDTIFSAYYYDCTILTALAAIAAGSDDPAKIKEKFLEVSQGGTPCKEFKECADLLAAGEDIDYEGASGPVNLNSKHEPDRGVYDVWEYTAEAKPENVADAEQIAIDAQD